MEFTQVRRIGVFKFRNIGDVLIMTPALRALRETFPKARISAVVNAATKAMLAGNPHIDETIAYERGKRSAPAKAAYEAAFLLKLRRRRFDLTVDFSSGDRSIWYTMLCKARYRLGFHYYKWTKKNWRYHAYTHIYRLPDVSMHEVEKHLWLLEQAGIRSPDRSLAMRVSPEAEKYARKIVGPLRPGKVVVVHPVSRWLWKCWDDRSMARTIDWLQEKRGARVVLTSSASPRELQKARAIRDACRTAPLFIAGTASLPEFAGLCAEADCFLGVDTAPMHIAAAVGTPVVALFGPSNWEHWHPWSERQITLHHDCPCHRQGKKMCDWDKTRACLAAITPAEVEKALDRFLGAR